MGSSRSLIVLFVPIILGLLVPALADDFDEGICTETADYCWSCSKTNDTFNNGSIYKQNLNTLLSSLPSINSVFQNSSRGEDANKVNVIALCRGDLKLKDCHTCFNESISFLFQNCTYQKEAIIWAQRCMIHYSNVSIYGVDEEKPVKFVPSPNNAENAELFKSVLNPLMKNLSEKAATGDSALKFAAGHALIPETNKTIYGLVQCTPELDKENCSDCLEEAISDIPQCCEGKDGGRVLRPSCTLRFENNIFYEEEADRNLSSKQGNSTSNITPKVSSPSSFCGLILSIFVSSALALF